MMNTFTFWQKVANTSWWIYFVFAYSMYACYCATKARTIFISMLYGISLLCLTVSFLVFVAIFNITSSQLLIWFEALLIGILLGWLQFRLLKVKAFKNENKIYVPGTWSSFVFIFLFLLSQYFPSLHISLDMQKFMQGQYNLYMILIYGGITGIMLGRSWYSFRCLKIGPFC